MSDFAEVEKDSSHWKLLKTKKRSSLFVRIRSENKVQKLF